MQRVLILGMSGAGKSTLAAQLGQKLSLPVTHLDNLYHTAGWVPRPEALVTAAFNALAATPQWVADGNFYALSHALRARADLIIFLDFPTLYCLGQILRRHLRHKLGLQRRTDLSAGLDDEISWAFLTWVWRWRRDNRPK